MPAPNEITPAQLLRQIGLPDAPVIVDISIDPDFADNPFLMPGSFRHPHTDIDGPIARLDGRACVITCQQGIKLSQGLTACLRQDEIAAEYLKGGMFWWHRDEKCTFEVMLDEFDLRTDAMDRLSTVIRDADTDRHDLAPEAAGLLARSVGLWCHYRDDSALLGAGMANYESLYRRARDGFEEGHDWPAAAK